MRGKPHLASTLGWALLALGVGVAGAYALDWHSHTCMACGKTWRHVGAWNVGDIGAHACPGCGQINWVKDGFELPPEVAAAVNAEPATVAMTVADRKVP